MPTCRLFTVRHRLSIAGWLCLLLSPLCLEARPEEYSGESAKWRRYQSPNFELFSANNDFDSRETLHNLELLRALFFDNFKLKERQPLGVTIYYFNSKENFSEYLTSNFKGNDNIAGYYLSQPDRATIVIGPAWDDDSARHLIFHEYIHHLIRISGEQPPLWYNEGVAELFSSIEIKSKNVEIGKPLPWHIVSLRQSKLLPLETLFAVDYSSPIYNTGTHSGNFYAESWALLHYWYYGESKFKREQVSAFMDYVRNETPPSDPEARRKVFQQTMGMDYTAMTELLRRYTLSGAYGWAKLPLPQIPKAESYEWRAMDLTEVREQLAELSLRATQSGKARLALLRAADRQPVKVRTFEVLGSDAWVQGEENLAQERWQKALDAGTKNPAIYHEVGLMESRRWFTTFNYYYQMNDELAERLRQLLKHSIAFAPEQFDAYEMLAWVEASVIKPNIANVNLVQSRFRTLLHKGPTLVALALVRLHLNDRTAAEEILTQAAATKPGAALTEVIRVIRSHLQPKPKQDETDSGEVLPERDLEKELPATGQK